MRRTLLWLVCAMVLASCSGAGQPAAPTAIPVATPVPGETSPDKITISFAAWDFERSNLQPIIKKFEAENPDIHVVIVPLDDLMNVMTSSAKGGPGGPGGPTDLLRALVSAADTGPAFGVTSDAFGTPLLLDLKPLMDADANFARDFYPGALEYWSGESGVWALPRSFYLHVLNYNKDAFAAAGLPEPQNGWSWQDLFATAEQLGQGNGLDARYGFADVSGGMLPMQVLLDEQGVDFKTLTSPDVNLTDPVYASALDQVRALYEKGALVNPYDGKKGSDPQGLLTDGRLGMWEQIGFGPESQLADYPFSSGYVAYPGGSVVSRTLGSGSDGYIISGGTAHPAEAWRWIEFLSRQPLPLQGDGVDMRIPARESLAQANGFWNGADKQREAAYRWTLEHSAVQTQSTYDYSAINALSQALYTAVSDPKADTDQLLADAQRNMLEMRAQTASEPTPTPDTRPVLVATPEPDQPPVGAIVIKIPAYNMSPTEIRQLARAFHQQNPDIFISVATIDPSTSEITTADLARAGDCFMAPTVTPKDAAALLDLRPLLDADTQFDRASVPEALVSAYTFDGGIYGWPYAFNLRTLTYNRTLFDQAGLPAPASGWSPQDFLQAAQALSTGEGEQRTYGYVPLGGSAGDMFFFVSKLGGRLTSGSGLDTRPTFTDPATVDALRWYLDLGTVHHVMPAPSFPYRSDQPYEDHSYELIQSGRAAMWFDYGKGNWGQGDGPIKEPPIDGMVPTAVPAVTFDAGIAPVLVGDGGLRSSDMIMRGWVISKTSAHPDACWELIKFATTSPAMLYGDLPANKTLRNSAEYTSSAAPDRLEMAALYEDILKRPVIGPGDDMNSIYRLDTYWLFQALSNTLEGKGELDAELEDAQKRTTTYMECVARGEKSPACALEADPDYHGYNVEQPYVDGPKG